MERCHAPRRGTHEALRSVASRERETRPCAWSARERPASARWRRTHSSRTARPWQPRRRGRQHVRTLARARKRSQLLHPGGGSGRALGGVGAAPWQPQCAPTASHSNAPPKARSARVCTSPNSSNAAQHQCALHTSSLTRRLCRSAAIVLSSVPWGVPARWGSEMQGKRHRASIRLATTIHTGQSPKVSANSNQPSKCPSNRIP